VRRVLLLLGVATALLVVRVVPAVAAGNGRDAGTPPATDYHVVVTEPGAGGPGSSGEPRASVPVCAWVRGGSTELEAIARDGGVSGSVIRDTAEDHILLVYRCDGRWDGRTWKWVIPVTAAELAADGLVEIAGVLPAPQPQTVPPAGRASIAGVAVLVWTDPAGWAPVTVTRSDPVTGLTATVVATPRRMRFDPGDGSEPMECSPPGVAYDVQLAGGDANVQLGLAGRCGHVYRLVTRNADGSPVAGRPATGWAAVLRVEWEVGWAATNGQAGRFAPITKRATFQRPVTEVQALITN
jgi:hypothetical protein